LMRHWSKPTIFQLLTTNDYQQQSLTKPQIWTI